MNRLQAKPKLLTDTLKYVLAFTAVALAGTLLIHVQGGSPGEAYAAILQGICGSAPAVGNSIRWITPCIFTGIAATVAFRSGVMNLGIEGQLYVGAFASAPLAAAAGMSAGGRGLRADLRPYSRPYQAGFPDRRDDRYLDAQLRGPLGNGVFHEGGQGHQLQ